MVEIGEGCKKERCGKGGGGGGDNKLEAQSRKCQCASRILLIARRCNMLFMGSSSPWKYFRELEGKGPRWVIE